MVAPWFHHGIWPCFNVFNRCKSWTSAGVMFGMQRLVFSGWFPTCFINMFPKKTLDLTNQKPSKTIKNHQKPSKTIKNHQKPSKTIKNHRDFNKTGPSPMGFSPTVPTSVPWKLSPSSRNRHSSANWGSRTYNKICDEDWKRWCKCK